MSPGIVAPRCAGTWFRPDLPKIASQNRQSQWITTSSSICEPIGLTHDAVSWGRVVQGIFRQDAIGLPPMATPSFI